MSNKAETKSSKCIVHSDFLEDNTIETDVSQNFVNNLDIKEQESDSKTNNLTDNLDIISSQDVSNIKVSDEYNDKNEDVNKDNKNEDDNYEENEDDNYEENPTLTNDTLFALRTYYQDYFEDETDIIQMLKTNLMDQHYSESQANASLKEFYNNFGINIDLTIFEEVHSLPSDQELFNEFFNSPNNGVLVSQLTNIINNMPNNIFNNVLMPTEDVLCTLDEEEKEKLNKFKLETKIDQKCNICLEEMIEGDEVVDLPCDHTYHSNCIFKYLEEYNYKCPTCRKEVGKPKYNI